MKHYGPEPPWQGHGQLGYQWVRLEDMWDGTTAWELRDVAARISVVDMSKLITSIYLPAVTEALNAPSFLHALEREQEFLYGRREAIRTTRTSRVGSMWSSVRSFLSWGR